MLKTIINLYTPLKTGHPLHLHSCFFYAHLHRVPYVTGPGKTHNSLNYLLHYFPGHTIEVKSAKSLRSATSRSKTSTLTVWLVVSEHNHYEDLELKGENVRSNTVLV